MTWRFTTPVAARGGRSIISSRNAARCERIAAFNSSRAGWACGKAGSSQPSVRLISGSTTFATGIDLSTALRCSWRGAFRRDSFNSRQPVIRREVLRFPRHQRGRRSHRGVRDTHGSGRGPCAHRSDDRGCYPVQTSGNGTSNRCFAVGASRGSTTQWRHPSNGYVWRLAESGPALHERVRHTLECVGSPGGLRQHSHPRSISGRLIRFQLRRATTQAEPAKRCEHAGGPAT